MVVVALLFAVANLLLGIHGVEEGWSTWVIALNFVAAGVMTARLLDELRR